jgi:hypothetical protein
MSISIKKLISPEKLLINRPVIDFYRPWVFLSAVSFIKNMEIDVSNH